MGFAMVAGHALAIATVMMAFAHCATAFSVRCSAPVLVWSTRFSRASSRPGLCDAGNTAQILRSEINNELPANR
jgi:hypothetical protein